MIELIKYEWSNNYKTGKKTTIKIKHYTAIHKLSSDGIIGILNKNNKWIFEFNITEWNISIYNFSTKKGVK